MFDSFYGNDTIKLVDVNLYALTNYYIYNTSNLKIVGGLSIAQMAYYFTKRKWAVGIVNCKQSPNDLYIYREGLGNFNHNKELQQRGLRQIVIDIDITPEISKILKEFKNGKIQLNSEEKAEENSENSNLINIIGEQMEELGTMIGLGKHEANVLTFRTRFGDQHSLSLKCFGDNTRILNKFGTNTTKLEQSQLWNTRFGTDGKYDHDGISAYFYAFKPTTEFSQINMYSKWIGKYNNDISEALSTLGYIFVDCRFIDGGAWSCGILMKKKLKLNGDHLSIENYDKVRVVNDDEEILIKEYEYFGKEKDEIKNHIGLVSVIDIDSNNNNNNKNKMIDLHLDLKERIDYFGRYTNEEKQMSILNQILNNSSKYKNIDNNSLNKLIEWRNKQREDELALEKEREQAREQQVNQTNNSGGSTSSGSSGSGSGGQSGKFRRLFSKKK